jgi:hypothetical protein
MAEIYQLPENGNGGNTSIPFSIPIGFGGMGNNGFGFGNGMNGIYDLLGVAIIASLFGWNGGGFGAMPMPKLEEKDFETEIENKAE